MAYPKDGGESVSPSPRFPDIERDVLAFWAQDGTFQASIDAREGEGILVVLRDGRRFTVTVDDAETGAALLAAYVASATETGERGPQTGSAHPNG